VDEVKYPCVKLASFLTGMKLKCPVPPQIPCVLTHKTHTNTLTLAKYPFPSKDYVELITFLAHKFKKSCSKSRELRWTEIQQCKLKVQRRSIVVSVHSWSLVHSADDCRCIMCVTFTQFKSPNNKVPKPLRRSLLSTPSQILRNTNFETISS